MQNFFEDDHLTFLPVCSSYIEENKIKIDEVKQAQRNFSSTNNCMHNIFILGGEFRLYSELHFRIQSNEIPDIINNSIQVTPF